MGKEEASVDREIARRQRAEAALREAERRYDELVESSEDLIWTHDSAGRVLSANSAMVRLTGCTREQIVGRQLADLLSPAGRAEFPAYLTTLAREGHAEGFLRLLTRAGEERVIQYESTARKVESGESIVFGVAHDVQRRWAERALRLSLSRLEALLNNVQDVAWMKDEAGRYTAVNEAFARFFDRRREDIVGRTDIELVPPEMAERFQAEDRSVLASGVSLRVINEVPNAAGAPILLETIKTVIRSGAGRPSGTVGIARDISERRQLEEQLVQSQKMEAMGRLAGGIAHDFNNLLTTILGYCDLVLSQIPADSSVRADLTEIERAGRRAVELTGQLLAFSRKQVVETRLLDLNGVLAEASRMLRRLIGENIDLVTQLDPELGRVQADPGQIEQILVNLAVNARDAMPRGGRLVVETSNVDLHDPDPGGRVPAERGPYVLLAVTDTGSGMDPETRRHIFEPFFTTKERGKGTGLGLATVYGIVKQNSGDILVQSEVGQGTRIEVYLPRAGDEAGTR